MSRNSQQCSPLPNPQASSSASPGDWWEWLVRLGNGSTSGDPPAGLVEALRHHSRNLPPPPVDTPPLGRPCPMSALLWHIERLGERLAGGTPTSPADQAQLAYHGRWILRLSAPQDPRWQALVSVVIPVFNRAALVCEAIASVLAQTHPAVEVIVVDDGSSDALAERLQCFGDQIRLLRQPHQGVSAARNLGLSVARGDYINFLDSDDRFDPDWIEAAVQAFGAIADADLCYAAPRQTRWPSHHRYRPPYLEPLCGNADCPSRGLMPVVAVRHPFLMLGVMLPRWRALALGGFDPALQRAEDTRFWFRLGLLKAKVIGLERRMNERNLLPTGLSSTAPLEHLAGVALINLLDLLAQVEHWPQVPPLLATLFDPKEWWALETSADPCFQQASKDLQRALATLVQRDQNCGHSPRPLLLTIQQLTRALPLHCQRSAQALPLAEGLARAADAALADCPACSEADRLLWLGRGTSPLLTADTALTLALMRDGHWWNLDRPGSAFWQGLQRAIRRLPSSTSPSPLHAGVIGRAAAHPAPIHHRNALARLCGSSPSDLQRQRLAYHADWLLSLLSTATSESPPPGPWVSIVIPVFNRSDTIAEAVACCLAQTHTNLEVLVIDDGSSEDIAAALHPFRDRIRLLRQEPNQGAGAARNLGISEARGTLIHFLDADDLLEPDTIARKLQALTAIPDADLVFSGARQTGEAAQEVGLTLHYLEPPPRPQHCPTDSLLQAASHQYPFLTSTVLVARWRLSEGEAGRFDPDLRRGQDEELFLRLALRQVKVVGIDGYPTLRRISERSLSIKAPTTLQLAQYRLRCLTDLLLAPASTDETVAALFQKHFEKANFELLVADRSATAERLRQDFAAALQARLEQATNADAGAAAARTQCGWCEQQLQAAVTQEPELAADAWMRALLRQASGPRRD